MLTDYYATKKNMTQAWTTDGKRVAVTKLVAHDMVVFRILSSDQIEVGVGTKRVKNVAKPQRVQFEKAKLSTMPAKIIGVRTKQASDGSIAVGTVISPFSYLKVGDLVSVSGKSKGRGFSGAMKRHGFHGGPKTHGQSDRSRAVGSIGAGTTPGRVLKGKRMPGHYGAETKTVSGLVVIHLDSSSGEIWLNGPIPGHINTMIKISPTGLHREVLISNVPFNQANEPKETVADSEVDSNSEVITDETN